MTARGQREAGSLTRMICERDHGDQNTADCGNKLDSARVGVQAIRVFRKTKTKNLASVHFPMMLWLLFGNMRVLGAHVSCSLIYMKWLRTISNNDSCMLWSVDARL